MGEREDVSGEPMTIEQRDELLLLLKRLDGGEGPGVVATAIHMAIDKPWIKKSRRRYFSTACQAFLIQLRRLLEEDVETRDAEVRAAMRIGCAPPSERDGRGENK